MTSPVSATSPTFPDALPFGVEGDFIDAQQAYELAMRVDQIARDSDTAFQTVYKPRAFAAKVTPAFAVPNGTTTAWGNLVSEWNTSFGALSSSGWQQARSEPESWYLLGAEQMIANTAGVPNTADHIDGMFQITTLNALTKVTTTNLVAGFVLNQETNSGGESFTFATFARLYQGGVTPVVQIFGPGTPTRQLAVESRFWGVRLGPVAF